MPTWINMTAEKLRQASMLKFIIHLFFKTIYDVISMVHCFHFSVYHRNNYKNNAISNWVDKLNVLLWVKLRLLNRYGSKPQRFKSKKIKINHGSTVYKFFYLLETIMKLITKYLNRIEVLFAPLLLFTFSLSLSCKLIDSKIPNMP